MKEKITNYLKAFIFILKFTVLGGAILTSWLAANIFIFIKIGELWEKACSQPFISTSCSNIFLNILQAFSFILGFLFVLFIFYTIALIIYMLKTEQIIEIKNSHQKIFHKEVTIKNWSEIKALYYRAKLHRSYNSIKSAVYHEKNDKITEYIKSFYPKFEYKNKWKPGADQHNFSQALDIINEISKKPKILENIPMTEESLKVTIINLENKEKMTITPQDNRFGLKIFYKDLLSEKLMDGNRFKITVRYKGLKGYNFKMWVKRKLI